MLRNFRVSIRGLLLLVVGCALLAWVGRGMLDAQRVARRSICVNNLCGIALALHNYHSAHGSLPPAYIADAQGKPMHSWRVLILPFLEQEALYNRYNFNEPWDGPNNRKLADEMPRIFQCPNRRGDFRDENDQKMHWTSYVALTGPGTAFSASTSTMFSDITDGLSNTILVTEVSNANIHWMEPRDLDATQIDLTINGPARPGISSMDGDGVYFMLADSSRKWFKQNFPPGTIKAMTTKAGGEAVDPEGFGP